MQYALRPEDVEIIPAPQRTIVIRSGAPRVQASISLDGSRIDAKVQKTKEYRFNEEMKPITIAVVGDRITYIHEGERLAHVEELADIILGSSGRFSDCRVGPTH